MAATDDNMEKFMGMFMKAMEKMQNEEREKRIPRIFDKDFMKESKEFDGSPDNYNTWSFKWRLSMKSSNKEFLKVIRYVEKMEAVVMVHEGIEGKFTDEGMHPLETWSTELYDVLAKKLNGDALITLQNVSSMCGFEVRRLLHRGCNPTSPGMALKALIEVIVPQRVANERELSKAIDSWSIRVAKINTDHGEEIGERLKIAVVAAMAQQRCWR